MIQKDAWFFRSPLFLFDIRERHAAFGRGLSGPAYHAVSGRVVEVSGTQKESKVERPDKPEHNARGIIPNFNRRN